MINSSVVYWEQIGGPWAYINVVKSAENTNMCVIRPNNLINWPPISFLPCVELTFTLDTRILTQLQNHGYGQINV